ncbi:MAG: histidine--tRNA ligase family protein [Candidatus Heimdallarchaeota archaeon]|nr:histidine--tRNA ligase family protein [Candidatus Heimdallarchaeota archaeon]
MDSELKEILKGIKGFRDFYPEDFAEINKILNIMHDVSTKFGFEEYEGPSLEYAKLIEYKSGQDLYEEVYSLEDREQRRLVLRPEQTPTLARLIANQHQRYPKPMRWYSIPRIFRDETPQRGRVKEHFQFNADIIGVDHVGADAEIIALTTQVIKRAGLKKDEFVCTINSRELVQNYLNHLGVENVPDVIRAIDSREKHVQSYIKQDLINKKIPKETAEELSMIVRTVWMQDPKLERFSSILQKDSNIAPYVESLQEIAENEIKKSFKKLGLTDLQSDQLYAFSNIRGSPETFAKQMQNEIELDEATQESLDKMNELAIHLKMFGVIDTCIYDASIARGLDYYTGIVFEFYDTTGSVVRAIAGGGRYDQLVENFGGGKIPCTGIGLGETVLYSILKEQGKLEKYKHPAMVYVAPMAEDVISIAAEIVSTLRENFTTLFNPFGWNRKKQLQDAVIRNIPYIVIVGKRDLENKNVTLKNLETREELIVPISDLTKELKKRIS